MTSKYLLFLVIPALFLLLSCSNKRPEIEDFMAFSFDHKKAEAPVKEKTVTEEKKQDEPVKMAEDKAKPAPENNSSGNIDTENFAKRYHLGYLTFDVADFFMELKPVEKTSDYVKYRFRFYSRTNGFVNYVFGWMSYEIAELKVYKDKVVPQSFKSKITLKKRTKEIILDYDENGQITYDQVTPPDNRAKRPAVENRYKAGSFDPLTITVETRRIVMNAFKNKGFDKEGLYKFKLPMYDGRRRMDVKFELSNKKVNDNYVLKFTMEPVAGYTNNELKDIKKGQRVIELRVSPETFTPVVAIGWSPLGTAKALFVHDCENGLEECVKNTKSSSNKKN